MPIPPFPALRAFHAAASHDRFRDAAESLGVTESAISHQVRRLEEFLHMALFERHGSGMVLTPEGQHYFEEIDPALRRIEEATAALVGTAGRKRVALTLPPSLAMLWLIPNLGGLEEACPGVDVQLITTARLSNLRREQIDLAIRHGRGSWPEVEASFLMRETAMPVASPDFMRKLAGLPLKEVLTKARLIVNRFNREEWAEWAAAHGLPAPDISQALALEGQEQVLEVTERGLGLAIGWRPMVDDRLKRGTLVAPFGLPTPGETGYYLCHASAVELTAAARAVARWLRQMAESPLQVGSEN
ncbi:MAG: LysR substrate-binding domain-containing protein [Kiloniellales bacterium]